MILLQIRSVQEHSGEAMKSISSVGREIVWQDKITLLLMHSTMSVRSPFSKEGLFPGGLTRERVDKYFVGSDRFATGTLSRKLGRSREP